jgi:hypothetical protein
LLSYLLRDSGTSSPKWVIQQNSNSSNSSDDGGS